MVENLQDELYQLENKQVKGAKLVANIRQEVEGEKCCKTFFKILSPWDQGQISICYITKVSQFFRRKKMYMLTGLKVSSLASKCVNLTDQKT